MRAAAGEGAGREPFPWETVLHVGLHLLRLSSRDFWALTPREFLAVSGGMKPRAVGLERAGLEELMRVFPDEELAARQSSPSPTKSET